MFMNIINLNSIKLLKINNYFQIYNNFKKYFQINNNFKNCIYKYLNERNEEKTKKKSF